VPRRSPPALACLAAALLAGCGDDPGDPPPVGTGPVPAVPAPGESRSPPVGPTAPAEPVRSVQITQLMLVYRTPRVPEATRTKDEARRLARDLLDRARRGTPLDDLVAAHTDDRGDDGRPFNRGSYSLDPREERTRLLVAAAKAVPVGELAPEPFDTGVAYLVFRRDR
jgi:hypothetical protein